MAGKSRTLVLDTRVNVTGEEKLGKLAKQYETAGQKMQNALSPRNLLAGAGITFGAAQVISFFGDAVTAASDMNETISKTGAILGQEALLGIEAWAEGAAEAFGQSKQLALDGASTFAIFGKSAGLAGDDLTGFSTDLVELAADLASFNNTSPEESIQAIGAALRGEAEPIRRYGVLLDDATLRQKAFELGIISSVKNALTPQQKVLAVQAELFEQTADAQGDYARTSDGLAGQQKELAAKLENVTVEIGEKLLPVMVNLVTFLNDSAVPAITGFSDALSDLGAEDTAGGLPIIGELESALNAVPKFGLRLNDQLTGMKFKIEDAAKSIGVSYDTLRARIHRVMEATGLEQEDALDRIVNAHKKVAGDLPTILPRGIKEATSAIDSAAEGMADGIPAAMEEAKEEAVKVARSTPGALADQLRAGIDDYDTALEELTEVAVNSVSDLAERQKIEGILASQQLTDALNSDSTRTRLLAQDLVADLVSDYELLAPGALEAGRLVNPNLARGLNSNLGLTSQAAEAIVDAAGNPLVDLGAQAYGWGATLSSNFNAGMASYIGAVRDTSIRLGDAAASGLRLRSPAEVGPLSEDASIWGRKLGEMFATGMKKSIPIVQGASIAIGGAAVPGINLNRPAWGTLSPLAGGGNVTNNFYLRWEGEPPQGRSESEIIANLRRLMPLAVV